MYILGISAFYHDSAACLLKSGNIIAAVQEERFTRKKHDPGFPHHAIKYCLQQARISPDEITNIVFYEKPFLKFERLMETYLAFAPRGFKSFASSMPLWIKEKLFQKQILLKNFVETLGDTVNWSDRLLFSEHHLSHAASAFYPSPFGSAAVLTLDGVGEWTTTSVALGKGKSLKVIKELYFPHSLGLLYSAFTYYTGFKVNSGEYKVMGLAPYGQPKYVNRIKDNLIHIAEDGSFQLDLSFFNFATGLTMTNEKFNKLFGGPPRLPDGKLTQRDMDLAASIQKVAEEVVLGIAKTIATETGEKNLCLAGGVALNCVINGVLFREKLFQNIWIQPAAGDAGGALGAAFAVWHLYHDKERQVSKNQDRMQGSFLGPEFTNDEIELALTTCGAKFIKLDDNKIIEEVVTAIIDQKAVGWMQGRMEFGPRALGARSILADPRSQVMQRQLNFKVKYRESFRPFAPSILKEQALSWFDCNVDSPYMLFIGKLNAKKRLKIKTNEKAMIGIEKLSLTRSLVPAVTHVDYSARIQTVNRDKNPLYYKLISRFYEMTKCPILVNTSFNIRGEPIICNPSDAFKCFMGTELDVLAIGNYLLFKKDQKDTLINNYEGTYELD